MAKNKYIGEWVEPESLAIDLPFTAASAEQVLKWGSQGKDAPYTHQDIAHWCDRFWRAYLDVDAAPEIERLMPILADVDAQWDLFLATLTRCRSCSGSTLAKWSFPWNGL